jgi:hypothetical protein
MMIVLLVHVNADYSFPYWPQLDSEIKRTAFRDLRRPTVDINDRLHDLRQDLNTLREEVTKAKGYIPYCIKGIFESIIEPWGDNIPSKMFDEVLEGYQELERFLMDTFQLLMSTISVLDSQASILDARRGARLTQLATIYGQSNINSPREVLLTPL